MTGRWPFLGIRAVICSAAALGSCGQGFTKDMPAGFDADGDARNRPAILMSAGPAAASATIQDVSATNDTANPLWGVTIESLHATRERPVFSPMRRPPAPPVVAAPVQPAKVVAAPPPEATLDLLGIVAGNGEGYAVFINNTTHDIVRLKTGEGESGWVLRSVNGREAVLEKNDRTEVLELPPITGVAK